MAPISFDQTPATYRNPGVVAEISNTRAIRSLVLRPYRALLFGQRLSSGTVAAGVLTQVTRAEQAATYFGRGSQLDRMVRAFKANNDFTALFVMPLDDLLAGVAAQGGLGFTGPATASGTLPIYIAGQRVPIAVASGNSATQVASAAAAAINAALDLPVTASPSGANVTLSARHKGVAGNSIDIRFNYYAGEAFPAGVACTITAMVGGSGNPDLTSAIAALGEEWFDFIVHPYLDGPNLLLLKNELDARWGPLRSIEGHAISAMAGTFSALAAFGATQNDPHFTVIGANGSPTPPWEWACALGGVASFYLNIDPARPLQTLPLKGVLAPVPTARFTKAEQNLLLYDGIATWRADADGTVRLQRTITTYQTSPAGADDPSYLDMETLLTLGLIRYLFVQWFLLRFPRSKLANDGTRFGPGQAVLTPGEAKAQCLAFFRAMENLGLVENFDQFATEIIVERDPTDQNRLNFLLPPDLVNQARFLAAKIEFVL